MRFSIREMAFSNKPVVDPLIFVLTIEVKEHRLFALQMIEKENHDVGTLQIIRIQGGPIFPFVNDRSFGGGRLRLVPACHRYFVRLERHLPRRECVSSAPCHDPAITISYLPKRAFCDRARRARSVSTQVSTG